MIPTLSVELTPVELSALLRALDATPPAADAHGPSMHTLDLRSARAKLEAAGRRPLSAA